MRSQSWSYGAESPGWPWLWMLVYPIRWYVRNFPLRRGKGFLTKRLLTPIIRQHSPFLAQLPGGAIIELDPSETIGMHWVIYGGFESAELEWFVQQHNQHNKYRNATFVDIGANIGLFSCVMSSLEGIKEVWAFEPVPGNVDRLRKNLTLNGTSNIKIFGHALSNKSGTARLLMAQDAAYGSLVEIQDSSKDAGSVIEVHTERLDSVWKSEGSPPIGAIKIDVEGAELEVLRGSSEVLLQHKPDILVEANNAQNYYAIQRFLNPFGYNALKPKGFAPWNYLFICNA